VSAIGLIIAMCRPILSAQDAEQSATAQIQVMDESLYRIQRDVRQSDTNGVFLCSSDSDAVSCSQASTYTAATATSALAVLTAESNGDGPTRWDSTGHPLWSGFKVYWLSAESDGANTLYLAFEPASVSLDAEPTVLNSDAAQAVSAALASTDPFRVASDILTLQSFADVTKDHVGLRLTGLTQDGASSGQLTVEGDAYARN